MIPIVHLAGALLFALGATITLLTSVDVTEPESQGFARRPVWAALGTFLGGLLLFLTGVGLMGA